jgi:hypothetical protein
MIPTFSIGQFGLGRVLTPPVTAYDSGDRTGSITVTGNITPDQGNLSNTVNGNLSPNATGACDMPGVGSTPIPNGAYIDWQFAQKQYFTKIRIRFNVGANMGGWFVKVGNSGLYIQVGSFTWNADDLEVTLSGLDPEGYTNIRIEKNGAGVNYTNQWFTEANFERAPGAT